MVNEINCEFYIFNEPKFNKPINLIKFKFEVYLQYLYKYKPL